MRKLTHLNRPCSLESQGTANSQELKQIEKTDEDGPNSDQDLFDMSDLICDEDNYLIQNVSQKECNYLDFPCYALHLFYLKIYNYEPAIADYIMSMVVFQFNFRRNYKQLRSAVSLYYWNKSVALDKYGHIAYWNVSNISNFSDLFMGYENFDENINSWNMSSAKTTKNMFKGATKFNQPLDKWDMSNVTDMAGMFQDTERFNQPINGWNTSKCTTIMDMFKNARDFNQPLDKWNTSKVINMDKVFYNTEKFDQDISSWDVGNVKTMIQIFAHSKSFDQDLSKWKFENLHVLRGPFIKANTFSHGKEFATALLTARYYRKTIYIGHNYRIDRGPIGQLKNKVNSEIRRTVPLIIF